MEMYTPKRDGKDTPKGWKSIPPKGWKGIPQNTHTPPKAIPPNIPHPQAYPVNPSTTPQPRVPANMTAMS